MTEETHQEWETRNARLAAEHSPSVIWTRRFWQGAGERAVKTAAQTFGAVMTVTIGSTMIPNTGILEFDWLTGLSVSAIAAVYSLVTSIGNADFTAGV